MHVAQVAVAEARKGAVADREHALGQRAFPLATVKSTPVGSRREMRARRSRRKIHSICARRRLTAAGARPRAVPTRRGTRAERGAAGRRRGGAGAGRRCSARLAEVHAGMDRSVTWRPRLRSSQARQIRCRRRVRALITTIGWRRSYARAMSFTGTALRYGGTPPACQGGTLVTTAWPGLNPSERL